MLIFKKYLYIWWKKNLFILQQSLLSSRIELLYYNIKLNLIKFSFYYHNNHIQHIQPNYSITYKFFFVIKTKHLFLFTLYLFYAKYLKIFSNFNFIILKKKIKKITILRAPCYHKNSKEQYGLDNYKGVIKSTFLYNLNPFYNLYILKTLNTTNINFITKYLYILKKNEQKYIK